MTLSRRDTSDMAAYDRTVSFAPPVGSLPVLVAHPSLTLYNVIWVPLRGGHPGHKATIYHQPCSQSI